MLKLLAAICFILIGIGVALGVVFSRVLSKRR